MGLDANLKRWSPAGICAMIALIAYFQAVGFGQLLSSAVGFDDTTARPALPHARLSKPAADPDHATSAEAILERNPFDSVTGPLRPGPADAESAVAHAHDSADPYADPPCTSARVLVIAGSEDPDWSFAVLAGPDGKSVLKRRGEQINGQTVHFVGDLRTEERRHPAGGLWDRVWLTSGGARCQAALGAKVPGVTAKGAPQVASASAMGGRIRQVGEHEFSVDRSAVEEILANPGELMKTRVLPVRQGDRVMGMRLMGIRPGSLFGTLGLQNGDVLTSINGFEMNDPQKMLEAYAKLMHADRLTTTVLRGGKPVNLEFNIK